ncbi:hypothetical protein GTQ99_00735 [Kineococcus sp. T13]|uniref:CARDB domain-containing protein n=1 Tax=Kineococcus vitellinus TaxID=2696565 RepID=UPI0014130B8C|nr:CARDB domain-containing protein [Kineococcus vitellinus]NAZ73958.1 hypothetical protein [Kineococcus vitellinus]
MRSRTRSRVRTAVVAAGVIALSTAGISAAQSAPAQPDLAVTAIDFTPTALVAGQQTSFRATITNKGNAPTPAGVIHGVAFSVAGQLRTWSDTWTTSLQPGQSVTVQANYGPAKSSTYALPAGTPAVTAHVDDAKRITESVESNNTLTRTANVATGLSTRLRMTATGVAAAATVAPSTTPTGLSSIIDGSLYVGCIDAAGAQVPGTERWLTEGTIGNSVYPWSGPFSGSGEGRAPAATVPVQVIGQDMATGELLRANQHGTDGVTCPAGASATFTRFQGKALTTKRWTQDGARMLASVTIPADVDIRLF